jgi:hypothetical protein
MHGTRSPVIEELNLKVMSRPEDGRKGSRLRVRCFICHQEIDRDMLVFVNHSLEEMACVCRKHLENFDPGPEF